MQNESELNHKIKYKLRGRIVLLVTLFLFWLMLNGSLAVDNILVGLFVSFIITISFSSSLSFFTEFRATPQAFIAGVLYYLYFFKELIKANFRLAAIVLSPKLPINPGIVKVRTKLKSRMGRLMLANSITLTPGTLTMELDGEWIYVHWVTVDSVNVEQATEQIVAGFESYLEVMYG